MSEMPRKIWVWRDEENGYNLGSWSSVEREFGPDEIGTKYVRADLDTARRAGLLRRLENSHFHAHRDLIADLKAYLEHPDVE